MRKPSFAAKTAAALALSTALMGPAIVAEARESTTEQPAAVQPTRYDPNRSLAPLVEAVSPAVVAIEVSGLRAAPDVPPMLRDFIDIPERNQMVRGEGSGFVISADGLLLTNHHVIEGAEEITVRFSDGTRATASVVGSDKDNDVALLRLPSDRRWPYVALGDSEAARVGDWVVAVGNPLGLGASVTTGIISGKGRNLGDNPYHAFLQTDAAINQGNSGGPLFDLEGRVVGMNTAIIQFANTVGFAVPSDTLKRLVQDLQDDGKVQRGFVGVGLQPIDAELAMALGLERAQGALITQVEPGLPGDKAGLMVGDAIVAIDGRAMKDVSDVIRTIGTKRPGDTIRVKVVRADERMTRSITLGERAKLAGLDPVAETPDTRASEPAPRLLGLQFRPGTRSANPGDGLTILAVEPGSHGAGKIQPGDRLVRANRVAVNDLAGLETIVQAAGNMVVLELMRGERRVFVAIPLQR